MHWILAVAVGLALGACDLAFGLRDRVTPDAASTDADAPSDAAACSDGLMLAVTDPWGHRWDGMERAPATLEVATMTCSAFGARLPTATELFRVNATRPGSIGQSFHTSPLWTKVPWDRTEQTGVRISDGTATGVPALSAAPYRCTCAPAQQPFFFGSRCNGPLGSECFRAGSLHIDAEDRPALRKSAAVAECAAEHAHLADFPELVEAIQEGLPGSGAYIATADQYDYRWSTAMRWMGVIPTWSPAANLSGYEMATPAPFRCAGPAMAVSAPTLANTFAGTKYAADVADSPVTSWPLAHSNCLARGGHLPRSHEYAELIQQGLPAGSFEYLGTSDQAGFNGTSLLYTMVRWTGLDLRYPYWWDPVIAGTVVGWDYKGTPHAHRCIYYPVDPAFTPPTTCNVGCFEVPTQPPSKLVIDAVNRPGATLVEAMSVCRQLGGHLTTSRDLTEAIRAGLLNGASTYVWTAEVGGGDVLVTIWGNAAEPNFNDFYMQGSSYSIPTNIRPYRCMWTNEIR